MRVSQFTALIAAALCLSCSDSSAPESSFAGTYALSTVNGQSLPLSFPAGDADSIRWLSGSVRALPSQSFSRQLVQERWEGGVLAETDTVLFSDSTSFYRQQGAEIQFYDVERDFTPFDTVRAFSGTLNAHGTVLTIVGNDPVDDAAQLQFER